MSATWLEPCGDAAGTLAANSAVTCAASTGPSEPSPTSCSCAKAAPLTTSQRNRNQVRRKSVIEILRSRLVHRETLRRGRESDSETAAKVTALLNFSWFLFVCNLFTDCKSHLLQLSQISIGATHYDELNRGAETCGLPNQQFPQRNMGDAP